MVIHMQQLLLQKPKYMLLLQMMKQKLYETLEAKFGDTYVLDDLLTFIKTYNII